MSASVSGLKSVMYTNNDKVFHFFVEKIRSNEQSFLFGQINK